MPTIVDRDAGLQLLEADFLALADLCRPLTGPQWDLATCLPGWTVRDVLSHVIGTEAMLAGEPTPDADVSHLTHMQNPIAEGNEVWVESMRTLDGSAMLERLAEVTARRMAALEGMTQADFDAPSWTPAGRDETYGRFMRIRHYDCFMHEHDIRGAVGVAPRSDRAALQACLDEVSTGLGYIVGRRARMPSGTRVRVDVTGECAATYLVEVSERAAVVDAFDRPPTVAVEIPVHLFLRLTGGRADGALGRNQIVVNGDVRLGDQLVDNLAFTI